MLPLPRLRARLLVTLLFAAFCAREAYAADIKTLPSEDGSANLIFVIGDIETGDASRFRLEAAKSDNAIVLLESDGGLVAEAIKIGEIIRLRGYSTGVINGSVCNSSCGLIWLAGTPRGLSKSARVGFHAAYSKIGQDISESGVANAIVGRYLTLLNLPEQVVIFATSSPPNNMNWITTANYSRVGIDLKVLDDFNGGKARTAAAEDALEVSLWASMKTFGVYIDHTLDNRCFIGSSYPDGTSLRIGYSGIEKTPYYFMIQNKKWASIREDSEYELKVLFDTDVWDMPVTGIKLGTDVVLTGVFSDNSFFADMAKAKSLLIRRGSTPIIKINLVGSIEAVNGLVSCQKTQNATYATDPFAVR